MFRSVDRFCRYISIIKDFLQNWVDPKIQHKQRNVTFQNVSVKILTMMIYQLLPFETLVGVSISRTLKEILKNSMSCQLILSSQISIAKLTD